MNQLFNFISSSPSMKANIFFHPSVCHWCKEKDNLKMCGNCKSISYCCKQHQMQDWKSHKDICKVISHTDHLATVSEQNKMEKWLIEEGMVERTYYFRLLLEYWNVKLKRNVFSHEAEILMFRRTCMICNSRSAPISCGNCLSVFYCSLDHQKSHNEKHAKFCELMKLCFDALLHKFHNFNKKYVLPLSKKTIVSQSVPENLNKLMEILMKESYIEVLKNLNICDKLRITDMIAPIGIILYALEAANLLKNNVYMKNDLVIHIVGANFEEQTWNWYLLLEIIFHWIKNMKMLTVAVVRPDAGTWDLTKIDKSHPPCGSCAMTSSNIKCYSSPNYYHDIVNKMIRPDIIVAFNCGIFALSTWENTIPCLLKYPGVPLVLTDYTLGYTEQNVSMMEKFSKKEIEYIVRPQRNPYSCITPLRHDHKSFPIYYNNGYIAIMKAK